jgi:hypothetical protein
MTLVLNLSSICLGKAILGIYIGITTVIGPRVIDETVPESHIFFYGTFTNMLITIGAVLAT